ncbi:MAG: DNA-3-methyladenine glycosylase [Candidatus Zixiibacteriota bacterium]
MRRKLPRAFFNRPTLDVSRDLIGKYLVSHLDGARRAARIVEVEAYIGEDDPASHAAPGPTKRNAPMYGKPGIAYIYFIYGMYYCLNVVTEAQGQPAAVLFRAAEPSGGFETVESKGHRVLSLSGPGKLCRGFGLTKAHNNLDLTGSQLYLEDRGERPALISRSTRIGIRKGTDRKWRFFDAGSCAVSGRSGKSAIASVRKMRVKR